MRALKEVFTDLDKLSGLHEPQVRADLYIEMAKIVAENPASISEFKEKIVSMTGERNQDKFQQGVLAKFPQEKLDPQPNQVSASDFANWIQESAQLARNDVYQNGQLATSPDKEKAPVLSDEYIQHAKALGEERVAQAGYRTADVLAQLFQ